MSGTIYVQQVADGTFVADVAELPGCVASGGTREEAVERVRRAFGDYLELLGSRGVSTAHWKECDPATFAVKDPPSRFTFPEDFRPLDEHQLRDFLHRLEASRSALLSLVRGLSAQDLERRPTETTWSVREALEHIAFTEVGLLAKLEKWPDRDFATLQAVHRMVFQRFTVMEPEDTRLDHEVMGRRWSTRKVMRRILEHEYEHYGHIKEIISALGGDRQPS
ncbi:MAG: type II toxin-antitoxin system HicB family antitoxin [Candidatus Limnocylindria bacterium]